MWLHVFRHHPVGLCLPVREAAIDDCNGIGRRADRGAIHSAVTHEALIVVVLKGETMDNSGRLACLGLSGLHPAGVTHLVGAGASSFAPRRAW